MNLAKSIKLPRKRCALSGQRLRGEEVVKAENQNDAHDHGQHVGHVRPQPFGDFQPFALVGFGEEILPAPAVAGGAENDEQQTAQGQQQVADQKILSCPARPARRWGGNWLHRL